MPRPKRSETSILTGDETRLRVDTLLDEAAAVFIDKGYAPTTITEIAQRAKTSKQTIYARYPSKENLFLAVLTREIALVFEGISLEGAAMHSLVPTLQAFAAILVKTMTTTRQVELLRIVVAESKQFPDAAASFYESGPRHVTRQLARYFSSQHRQGNLQAPDADMAAEHFFELTTGAMVRRALLGQATDPESPENKQRMTEGVKAFLLAYRASQLT